PHDLAIYDSFGTDRAATGDPELSAAIVIEPIGERSDGKFRIDSEKFLLLLRSRAQAIATHRELPNARYIEIIPKQPTKAGNAVGDRNIRPQRAYTLCADIGDETCWVGPRGALQGKRDNERECRKETGDPRSRSREAEHPCASLHPPTAALGR